MNEGPRIEEKGCNLENDIKMIHDYHPVILPSLPSTSYGVPVAGKILYFRVFVDNDVSISGHVTEDILI